ncbi:hypothetical protein RHOSPDRAFT_26177 [Rhodotorula sp. JG-1b]|nr:hypothetical protein RHOSPDRAFT_26177 [Rhodotorula sp. JG-1b]
MPTPPPPPPPHVDPDAVDGDGEVSLVLLPARAATVAMALSGISSLVALILVIEGTYITTMQHGRFRPPESTRLWQFVDRVMTYLILFTKPSERPQFLSLLTLGLSLAVIIEILAPLVSCQSDNPCSNRPLAVKTICALSLSLLCILALAFLVIHDLRRNLPHARALLGFDDMRRARYQRLDSERWNVAQVDEERALVDRAKLPFDGADPFRSADLTAAAIASPPPDALDSSPFFPLHRSAGETPPVPSHEQASASGPAHSPVTVMLTPGHGHGHHHGHQHDHHAAEQQKKRKVEEKRHKAEEKKKHRAAERERKRAEHKRAGLERQRKIYEAREAHEAHLRRQEIVEKRHKAERAAHAAHEKAKHAHQEKEKKHEHGHEEKEHGHAHEEKKHGHAHSEHKESHHAHDHDHADDRTHAEHQKTLHDLPAERKRRQAEKKEAKAKRAAEKEKRRAHHSEAQKKKRHKDGHSGSHGHEKAHAPLHDDESKRESHKDGTADAKHGHHERRDSHHSHAHSPSRSHPSDKDHGHRASSDSHTHPHHHDDGEKHAAPETAAHHPHAHPHSRHRDHADPAHHAADPHSHEKKAHETPKSAAAHHEPHHHHPHHASPAKETPQAHEDRADKPHGHAEHSKPGDDTPSHAKHSKPRDDNPHHAHSKPADAPSGDEKDDEPKHEAPKRSWRERLEARRKRRKAKEDKSAAADDSPASEHDSPPTPPPRSARHAPPRRTAAHKTTRRPSHAADDDGSPSDPSTQGSDEDHTPPPTRRARRPRRSDAGDAPRSHTSFERRRGRESDDDAPSTDPSTPESDADEPPPPTRLARRRRRSDARRARGPRNFFEHRRARNPDDAPPADPSTQESDEDNSPKRPYPTEQRPRSVSRTAPSPQKSLKHDQARGSDNTDSSRTTSSSSASRGSSNGPNSYAGTDDTRYSDSERGGSDNEERTGDEERGRRRATSKDRKAPLHRRMAAKSPIVFEKVIVLPLVTMLNECRAFVWLRASSLEPVGAPSMSTTTLLAFGNREAQIDRLRGMSEVLPRLMSYYPFDADTDKEVSLVFLPARAAAVATALSGVASFIALVFTAEVAYCVDSLGRSESALLEVTAVFCGVVVATGVALIYVRVQPPTASNLWAVVPQVISYVMVLCLATIGFATASISVALVPLARCDDETCKHQTRAIRTICALAIAIVATASLGILATYDLWFTRPEAQAAVYRAEIRETMLYARWRRDQVDGEALWVARSAWTNPTSRDPLNTRVGELSGCEAPSWESRRTADFPTAPGLLPGAPLGTAAAPNFWPRSLASVESSMEDGSDQSPRRRKHRDDPSTDGTPSDTGTSDPDDVHKHRHKHPHSHHHHHHHHTHDGTTSDSDESSCEEDRRRRSNKATVDANVMSRQSAASSVASAGAGDAMPAE